jgi:hypothetical protein
MLTSFPVFHFATHYGWLVLFCSWYRIIKQRMTPLRALICYCGSVVTTPFATKLIGVSSNVSHVYPQSGQAESQLQFLATGIGNMHEHHLHWCLLSSVSSVPTDRSSIPITLCLNQSQPLTKQVFCICSIWMLWCLEIITNNLQVIAWSLLDGKFWCDIIKWGNIYTWSYIAMLNVLFVLSCILITWQVINGFSGLMNRFIGYSPVATTDTYNTSKGYWNNNT